MIGKEELLFQRCFGLGGGVWFHRNILLRKYPQIQSSLWFCDNLSAFSVIQMLPEWNWRKENIVYCSDVMPTMPLLSLSVYSCCNSSEELFILKGYTFCMAGVLSLWRKEQVRLTRMFLWWVGRDYKLFINHYGVKICVYAYCNQFIPCWGVAFIVFLKFLIAKNRLNWPED